MAKKIIISDVMRVVIIDDTHENAEFRINELFLELKVKADEICFERYAHYVRKGQGYTYAVIRYQQKNPAE